MCDRYAYVEFKDEATADAHYRSLQGREVAGAGLTVDYVGAKSVLRREVAEQPPLSFDDLDPKRLYITGFPRTTVAAETIRKLFPRATAVVVPIRNKDKLPLGSVCYVVCVSLCVCCVCDFLSVRVCLSMCLPFLFVCPYVCICLVSLCLYF